MNIHSTPKLTAAETALIDAFGERLSDLPGDAAVAVKRDDAIEIARELGKIQVAVVIDQHRCSGDFRLSPWGEAGSDVHAEHGSAMTDRFRVRGRDKLAPFQSASSVQAPSP